MEMASNTKKSLIFTGLPSVCLDAGAGWLREHKPSTTEVTKGLLGQRTPDLPVVPVGIHDAAQAPAVFFTDWIDFLRARG